MMEGIILVLSMSIATFIPPNLMDVYIIQDADGVERRTPASQETPKVLWHLA